ncbi:hypothetical protein N866_15225 [Actinotalea ferrariae CF5-4]|uniref:HNH nuclease domain-containing protein n=1 Tax=Actinotalea ferrariae CF5-4 TaxID=948458 RepID=A0A021W184_9CELL|nr:HNH endonuclease signature motif containing protein [Actinotalea ferrariae]EYR65092.1 hypothetical protein N866_15225 [Actinotalea ferrariae CF5-4]
MFDRVLVERTAEDDVAAALAYARSHAGRSIPCQDIAVRWALANPHAARLAAARPGPALAAHLVDLGVANAPSEDLLEAVGAWDRLAAWVVAQQARVLQELHRRVELSTWAQKGLQDEVAGTLAASGRAVKVLLDRSLQLAAAPEVHDALLEGVLSVRKADVLLHDTGMLSGVEARRVHEQLLPEASRLTAPELGAAARRAVLEIDPDAAEHRHRRAREDRTVVLEPAADCMATIRAFLPAVEAVKAMRALDAVAATAAPDDPRGIDARRADALVDVLAAVLDRGVAPDGEVLRTRKGRAPRLSLTISTDALAGASTTPGHLDGYGPVLPSLARRLAQEATWHFQRTDPATGEALEQAGSRYRPPDSLRSAIVARDVTCTFPGCRITAEVCDLDHTIPYDDTREPGAQTRRSNLAALCRHHHRLKTHTTWSPRRDPASGVTIWISPRGKPYARDPVRAPGESWPRHEDGRAGPHRPGGPGRAPGAPGDRGGTGDVGDPRDRGGTGDVGDRRARGDTSDVGDPRDFNERTDLCDVNDLGDPDHLGDVNDLGDPDHLGEPPF